MTIRSALTVLGMLVCSATHAWGQPVPQTPETVGAGSATWSFGAAVYTYVLPDQDNYAQPTVTADRDGGLHLEARFNYEDLETGSAWVGYTFGGENALEWELTPLFGGVFGETTGIAPGYKASVNWRMFEGYSEGEYVFDTGASTDSFFYNWSELTIAPVSWFRGGMVTQRTRAYHSDHEIQRGLLVGTTYQKLDVTAYVFNLDDSQPTVVVAVGVNW